MKNMIAATCMVISFGAFAADQVMIDESCYNSQPTNRLVSGTSNLYYDHYRNKSECVIHGTFARVSTAYMTPAGEAVWHSDWMSEEDAKKLKDKKDVSLSPAYNNVIQHKDF